MNQPLIPGRHRPSRLTATLARTVLALCVLRVSSPTAAPRAKNEGAPYIEREEVRFVTVDLVVQEHGGTGGRGWHLARDLRKNQVHLLVGGHEMALDVFENRCGASPAPSEPALQASSGPASAGSAAGTQISSQLFEPEDTDQSADPLSPGRAGSSSTSSTHKYVLFFDVQHLTQGGRNAASRSAMDWASRVPGPEDQVMIVSAGRSLRVVRPLLPVTGSLREEIGRAMEDFGNDDLWAEGEWIRIDELKRLARWNRIAAESLAKEYAVIDQDRTRRAVENMRDLMALFDAIPGTKNLVLFDETLRLVPGNEYFGAIGMNPEMLLDVHQELDEVVKAANERNVRIYAVNTGGMSADFTAGLEIDSALTMLSTETGGGHVQGTNQIGRILDRVAEDLDCFYRLGFRISPRHIGKTERITVRIGDDPLRYRMSYRRTLMDPTRVQQDQEAILAAYLAPESAHGFPVSVAARRLYDHPGGTRFRIEVSVPLEGIFIRPNPPAGGSATLLFGGQVVPLRAGAPHGAVTRGNPWLDVDPKRESWGFDRQADLHLPASRTGAGGPSRVLYATEMDAPPGEYRLVAVAEDAMTRAVSAGVVDLTARESADILGEPLLAVRDPRIVFIDGTAQSDVGEAPHPEPSRIMPARASVPEKLDLSTEPSPAQGPGKLLYPVCLGGLGTPSAETGELRARAAGWRLQSRVICGENSRSLPPLPLAGLLQDAGCSLVAREVPEEIWTPGPCRVESSLEGDQAPPEIRLLELLIRQDSPTTPDRIVAH